MPNDEKLATVPLAAFMVERHRYRRLLAMMGAGWFFTAALAIALLLLN